MHAVLKPPCLTAKLNVGFVLQHRLTLDQLDNISTDDLHVFPVEVFLIQTVQESLVQAFNQRKVRFVNVEVVWNLEGLSTFAPDEVTLEKTKIPTIYRLLTVEFMSG